MCAWDKSGMGTGPSGDGTYPPNDGACVAAADDDSARMDGSGSRYSARKLGDEGVDGAADNGGDGACCSS